MSLNQLGIYSAAIMSITMDKSKLKIAFFGRTISVSETFIKQLLFGLNEKTDLTFINGQNQVANYNNVKEITSGVKVMPSVLKNRYLSLLLRKLTPNLVIGITKSQAFKKLENSLNAQNFDVAYTDYGMSAVQILPYLKHRKIPLVVHFHGYDITSELNNTSYRRDLISVFSYASRVIAASNHIKRLLIIEGCPAEKINVVRYGISIPDGVKPTPWEVKFQSDPKVIFIGRLVEKKNPLALIEAFKITHDKHNTAKLHIVGDGHLLENCKERAKHLKLIDHIIFYGAQPHHEIFKHLEDAWIYVQHSVSGLNGDQEGFAISPAEAALMELPVASTYHNGIPEHVLDGKTGLLAKEYDYETMGSQISYLLDNREVMINYGQAGKENILEMCNPERRIKEVAEILYSVVND